MARAAIDIPPDYREGVRQARDREQSRLARFVLTEMLANWELATADRRPMCADTGLPRYYVRAGNEVAIEAGSSRWSGRCAGPAGRGHRDHPAAPEPRAPSRASITTTT